MSRRTVRVELDKFSATVTGPRLRQALALTGARWMPHPTRRHRSGAIQVHRDDVDDLLVALELDGQLVEVVDRDGKPVAVGGLLGGVA